MKDIAAERAILAAIIVDGKIPKTAFCLSPDDFYDPIHGKIYSVCLDLHELGDPIDVITVSARSNGHRQYVLEIGSEYVTSANIGFHAGIVHEHALKRALNNKLNNVLLRDLSHLSSHEIINELRNITEEFDFKGKTGKESGILSEVRRFVGVTTGEFSVTEVGQHVTGVTSVTNVTGVTNVTRKMASIRKALQRLKDEGLIVSSGKRNGVYRRVDKQAEVIEWWKSEAEPIDLHFPLGVEEYVSIYPRNIVVYAGTANSGKTAHLLNIAWNNRNLMPVTYLSSEMAETELKIRIDLFNYPDEEWRKITFRERSSNFSEVIDPDGLTIIDFLEINDNFYMVASHVKDIYDRLNKGVCIIGIQKPAGRDTGRGGEMGLEKPRLYIAVDHGRAKIIKAKAWKKPLINPNGLVNEYKLVHGCHFMAETGWMHETENENINKTGWKKK